MLKLKLNAASVWRVPYEKIGDISTFGFAITRGIY
jgi:hypothetical protein